MAGTLSLDAAVAESRAHVEKVVRRNTGLFLVQAVLMIVAGLVALVYPLVTTLAVTLFLGWMLVFSGIVQAITLIANARLPHFWLQLVSAVLSVVVGLLFIRNPGVAVTTLALLLVIYFFVEGIAKVVLAISVRPMPNWGWILVSGDHRTAARGLADDEPGAVDRLPRGVHRHPAHRRGRRHRLDGARPAQVGPVTAAAGGAPRRERLVVNLALQGGGSHGAFTWGALDRLLEEDWIEVDGISGTSAGAMNAAVFAHGYGTGGRDGARAALEDFWRRVSRAALLSPFQRTPVDRMTGTWSLDHSPTFIAMDLMARLISPYAVSGATNPLAEILAEVIDFERLATGPVELFVTATNVRTGRGRVFRKHEITPDVLLASACLPTMFQAIEIDGEPYWDGGFSGNPTLTPLVRECESRDTLPRSDQPGRAPQAAAVGARDRQPDERDLLQRRAAQGAADDRRPPPGARRGQRRGPALGADAHPPPRRRRHGEARATSSKLNAEWAFLTMLRDEGRKAAQDFGLRHRADIGRRSTYDLDSLLEGV